MKHNKDRFLNATQAEKEFGKFCASHKSCKQCGADSHGVSCRMWWMFMFDESDEQSAHSERIYPPEWQVEFSTRQPRLRPRRNHDDEIVRDEVQFPNSGCERWLRESQLLADAARVNGIGIDWSALGGTHSLSTEQERTRHEQGESNEQEHEEGYHT